MSSASAKVKRLVASIEREEGRDQMPDFARCVNKTEEAFILAALRRRKGTVMRRDGWPDFLVEEGGKIYAVEVKADQMDRLRKTQLVMFEALERLGLPIYIWIKDRPGRLTNWRVFDDIARGRRLPTYL